MENRELRISGETKCFLSHPLRRCQHVSSLFGLFFAIIVNFQYIIRTAEEGVAITVFFDEDATDEQKDAIGQALEEHEGVSRVHYVSADEAWEEFQEQYFGDNPETG